MRDTVAELPTRVRRLATDLALLATAGAEERTARRTELAESPADVDPLEHGGHQDSHEVGPWWQRSGLHHAAESVSHDVPARL